MSCNTSCIVNRMHRAEFMQSMTCESANRVYRDEFTLRRLVTRLNGDVSACKVEGVEGHLRAHCPNRVSMSHTNDMDLNSNTINAHTMMWMHVVPKKTTVSAHSSATMKPARELPKPSIQDFKTI